MSVYQIAKRSLLLAVLISFTFVSKADFTGLTSEVVATSDVGTTYRIYANFDDGTDIIQALFAEAPYALSITSTAGFYQDPLGGLTPDGIQPLLYGAFPNLAYDSWITLGQEDATITPSFGVSFHISGWMMGGPKNHPINGSIWMMMEPPKRSTPSVTPLIAPYVVHDSWISGFGSKPPPWAERKLLFFASTIPKTYMKDYSGKNALIRFELWKRYRDDANVSVRASWRECAPGRCDALYYNHTDDRVPSELYRAEAMRHRFCVVAPGDTPATKKLAETIAFAAHGGCLPALYGGTAHLPYASQIDYSRIALLLHVEEGLWRLHAMTAAEAHERVAYARRVYHAFVQSEGSSWETPSAAEVAIQEACRISVQTTSPMRTACRCAVPSR